MKSVLIVDDEPEVAQLFAAWLKKEGGYVTTLASNGHEAWEILNGGLLYDIVLSDKDTPIWSGLDLLCRVRADEKFDGVRFVLVSGADVISRQNPRQLQEVCAELGAQFLQKPFTPPELLKVLRGG